MVKNRLIKYCQVKDRDILKVNLQNRGKQNIVFSTVFEYTLVNGNAIIGGNT